MASLDNTVTTKIAVRPITGHVVGKTHTPTTQTYYFKWGVHLIHIHRPVVPAGPGRTVTKHVGWQFSADGVVIAMDRESLSMDAAVRRFVTLAQQLGDRFTPKVLEVARANRYKI